MTSAFKTFQWNAMKLSTLSSFRGRQFMIFNSNVCLDEKYSAEMYEKVASPARWILTCHIYFYAQFFIIAEAVFAWNMNVLFCE